MHVLKIGPIHNNPSTLYTLIFGKEVPSSKILDSFTQSARMREALGLTTQENTLESLNEVKLKLESLFG